MPARGNAQRLDRPWLRWFESYVAPLEQNGSHATPARSNATSYAQGLARQTLGHCRRFRLRRPFPDGLVAVGVSRDPDPHLWRDML